MSPKHHLPKRLNILGLSLDYNIFGKELSNAQYALGLLQGSQRKLLNSELLVSPLTAKEAKESSSIEGTVSTVSDVFLLEAGGTPKYGDTQQVANYRSALKYAMEEFSNGRKLSHSLLHRLHQILLQNVRHKGPLGKYRDEIVYIAEKETDPIEKALYVPMLPITIYEYMGNLIDYVTNGSEDILIRTGIFHYQFEAIHPFNDGNGRIGRLLVPLILCQDHRISKPILYISGYLEKFREEYRESLHDVDVNNRYEKWLAFYFKAVSMQLNETQKLVDEIIELYENIKSQFELNKSPYLIPFLNHLFESPATTIPMAKKAIKASARNTVSDLFDQFIKKKLVIQTKTKYSRAKIYAFVKLLDLL